MRKWNPNPYKDVSNSFTAEWRSVHDSVRERCQNILSTLKMTPECIDYVSALRGYQRIPHLAVSWVKDQHLRQRLGEIVGVHCIGIKLLDDVIDRDQPFDPIDLCLGSQLLNEAVVELCAFENPVLVLKCIQKEYRIIWGQQWDEVRNVAKDLPQWYKYAHVKAGLVMSVYAEVSCLASGQTDSIESACNFAKALGIIVMASDDLRDHLDKQEEGGNLGWLLRKNAISIVQVRAMIKQAQEQALFALKSGSSVANDVSKIVNAHVTEILDYQLPEYES